MQLAEAPGRRDHRTIQCVFQHQFTYGTHEKRQDHHWDKNKLTQDEGPDGSPERLVFLFLVKLPSSRIPFLTAGYANQHGGGAGEEGGARQWQEDVDGLGVFGAVFLERGGGAGQWFLDNGLLQDSSCKNTTTVKFRTEFPLNQRSAELGLGAGAGNAGGEATETEALSRRTGAAEPRHTESSRLALKHDLEIRELQADTFRTMLVKYDEPLVQASKAATGLFVTKSKGEQRSTGEPHVYGWAAIMTALTTDPALSSEDKQKVAGYTSSANSPETLLQSVHWSQFKNTFQKDWVKWQCSVDSQAQPILCLIIKAMKARGAKEKFGKAPAGGQRARTPTDARRSLTQAGDNGGGQQSLTSWLRPKTPSVVRTSAEDSRGGQRLLTSWMRPKSSHNGDL